MRSLSMKVNRDFVVLTGPHLFQIIVGLLLLLAILFGIRSITKLVHIPHLYTLLKLGHQMQVTTIVNEWELLSVHQL